MENKPFFHIFGTYWFIKYKGSLRNTNFLPLYTKGHSRSKAFCICLLIFDFREVGLSGDAILKAKFFFEIQKKCIKLLLQYEIRKYVIDIG